MELWLTGRKTASRVQSKENSSGTVDESESPEISAKRIGGYQTRDLLMK